MSKRTKNRERRQRASTGPQAAALPPGQVRLKKGSLGKVKLGHPFAEFDPLLAKTDTFVSTPASLALKDRESIKVIFVGRRGTGKTALTLHHRESRRKSHSVVPQGLVSESLVDSVEQFRDMRAQPFKSLKSAFKKCILLEAFRFASTNEIFSLNSLPLLLQKHRNMIEQLDFDLRLHACCEEILPLLEHGRREQWLKAIKQNEQISREVMDLCGDKDLPIDIVVDRIDDSWDGSDASVIALDALLHASIEIRAEQPTIRSLVFLRENLFERIRIVDNEFGRLESSVASLDWSRPMLREFVERRLCQGLTSKPALGGAAWDSFFDLHEGKSSFDLVASFCQDRPRDYLVFANFAIENAVSDRKERVEIEHIMAARARFSDSRLKDIADEYAENYPRIELVLRRFFGLGKEFTVPAVEDFIAKLIADPEIQRHCSTWLNFYTNPLQFIELLYAVGFAGIRSGSTVEFRSVGAKSTRGPQVLVTSHLVIHEAFAYALQLQDRVVEQLDASQPLKTEGLVEELPSGISITTYVDRIEGLQAKLSEIKPGREQWKEYEDLCGEVLRYCFFRWLTNVEPQSRTEDGIDRRDWIASNRSRDGFWEIMRSKHNAVQVIWECKNKLQLEGSDFRQAGSYQSDAVGWCTVLSFRGDRMEREHIVQARRAMSLRGGVILVLGDKDLQTFLRQAKNQKVKDAHIHNIYDSICRSV